MRKALFPLSLLFVTLAAACKSTHCDAPNCPQAVVERVAKENPAVTRLTVHCKPANASAMVACASTAAEKKGKPSDPEDKRAMETGQTVVLDETGALDVTVPILVKDGKCAAVCGVTLKADGTGREQQVAKATAVARSVEAGLGGTCNNCCSDCCK